MDCTWGDDTTAVAGSCGGHVNCTDLYDMIIDAFGTSASDAVSYSTYYNVGTGIVVNAGTYTALKNEVNSERLRRGQTELAYSYVAGTEVDNADFNALRDTLVTLDPTSDAPLLWDGITSSHSSGSTYVPSTASVVTGNLITAANVNSMIQELQTAGASCFCNCNYCACNCNQCSCNCNYGCTCNCNYSDKTLKENIEYL